MFDVFRLILECTPHVGVSPLFAVIPAALAVPAAASVVGGLINGISSLFGSHKRASTEEKINQQNIAMQRETNALNKQMADESNALQYQMFNEANQFTAQQKALEMQYNSPIEQKNRALAAGINPNITDMGNVQGASSVSSPNSTTPQFQSPQAFQPTPFETPRFGDAFSGLAQILLQSRALDIEQEKADYEGEKTYIQRSDSETKRRSSEHQSRMDELEQERRDRHQQFLEDSQAKLNEHIDKQIESLDAQMKNDAARLALDAGLYSSNIRLNGVKYTEALASAGQLAELTENLNDDNIRKWALHQGQLMNDSQEYQLKEIFAGLDKQQQKAVIQSIELNNQIEQEKKNSIIGWLVRNIVGVDMDDVVSGAAIVGGIRAVGGNKRPTQIKGFSNR